MASCQQFDIAEVPFQEEEKQMSADYNMSSKGNEDVEFAYVRVGVYEAVENHSVTITRMWIEGRNSSIEPTFPHQYITRLCFLVPGHP